MSAYLSYSRRQRMVLFAVACFAFLFALFGSISVAQAQDTDVPDGAVPSEVAANITGRVVNLAGQPVAGAKIETSACIYDLWTFGPCPLEEVTTTNSAGRYTIPIPDDIGFRDRYIRVTTSNYHTIWYKNSTIQIKGVPGSGELEDIVLSPNGSTDPVVVVTVRSDGTPLAGIEVIVRNTWLNRCDYERVTCYFDLTFPNKKFATDASGQVSITLPETNNYHIDLVDPTDSYVQGASRYTGERSPSVAFFAGNTYQHAMTMLPAGIIKGKVTNESGDPAVGVTVRADCSSCGASKTGETGADGTYEIKGLAPGSWQVRTERSDDYLPEFYRDGESIGSVALELGATKTGINIQVKRQAKFSGRVTDAEGNPIAGIEVSGRCLISVSNCTSLATTNVKGEYTVQGLEEGKFRVSTYDPAGLFKSAYYLDADEESKAMTVTLEAGETIKLEDMKLKLGGTIVARVINKAGDPISGGTAGATSLSAAGGFFGPRWSSNDGGQVVIGNLNTGEYIAWASPYDSDYAAGFHLDAEGPEDAKTLSVEAGKVINGILIVLSRVDGTIPAPQGWSLTSQGGKHGAEMAEGRSLGFDAPNGAVDADVRISISPKPPQENVVMGDPEDVDAASTTQFLTTMRFTAYAIKNGLPVDDFTFAAPVQLTVVYTDTDVFRLNESAMQLYIRDPETMSWGQEGITFVSRDLDANEIVFTVTRLGHFGLFEDPDAASQPEGATIWLPHVNGRTDD